MGTSGRPGYVFRDFCLKQGIDFIIFCLNQGIDFINFFLKLDCLRSAFSLKIRPVLFSSSAIANHDVIIYALVSRDKRPRHSRALVSRAVTLQRKIRDCSQSRGSVLSLIHI